MNDEPVQIRSIGSFFVGGSTHTLEGLPVEERRTTMARVSRPIDPNGDHVAGQMYVQHFALGAPKQRLPVLLWHGGGMTGSHWENTPDGRPGWVWRFLQEGYDVYVSDAVERGRSSWAKFPEIYGRPPIFRSKNEGWHMFRIGPPTGYATDTRERRAYSDTQFPIEHFDVFAKQWVPRWTGHEEITSLAYDALIQRVGPCIVVAHSQGGGFAVEAAQKRPGLVKAVVVIEPAGMPAFTSEAVCPHLAVWGDHLDGHAVWQSYRQIADRYWVQAIQHGMAFEVIDLPLTGISGNSHFPMSDFNSDDIAEVIFDWLSKKRF